MVPWCGIDLKKRCAVELRVPFDWERAVPLRQTNPNAAELRAWERAAPNASPESPTLSIQHTKL
jgi:hypothetical protein